MFGSRCLQASVAAMNCGELGSIPELALMSMLALRPFLLTLGSGMFGSPWVRRQAMKARALETGLALLPLCAAGAAVVVVAFPRLATPG